MPTTRCPKTGRFIPGAAARAPEPRRLDSSTALWLDRHGLTFLCVVIVGISWAWLLAGKP